MNDYQSERQIEQSFIDQLQELKYTYRSDIRSREALHQNFREKFNKLNYVNLSDSEFERLLQKIITADVFDAARMLREPEIIERDDGTPLFYTLVNTSDWCKNEFEVVNQLRMNTNSSHHRYDVLLLMNGIPVVQVELKKLDISPRRAMQQIQNYKNDPSNGYTNSLLCYIQLFIASSETQTWYFANNNAKHFQFNAEERYLPAYKFADINNRKIDGLYEFTEKFLSKCVLSEMISRYIVMVATEQRLLVMRPYQIYAVKAIVETIEQNAGNGYIWHTTGSGKTLTSFKAATLLKDNPNIYKCLFVVDRKDLDRQTREEFNRFQEGSVEQNTNTASLVRRLLSDRSEDKIIVTTIQKLGLALDGSNKKKYKQRLQEISDKRIVFIFDECHRSQFGDNHQAIKEFFPNAQLFGFTGTPIFEQNSSFRQIDGQEKTIKTTADIFQKQLHSYTITHAIEDKNVLQFHVDYYKPEGAVRPRLSETSLKRKIVERIIEKHDQATFNRKFNAIFATASINDAIAYYKIFQQVQAQYQAEHADYQPLHIACVFSPPASVGTEVRQTQEDLPQELADYQQNPEEKHQALKSIIADYNIQFGGNHNTKEFDLYYQDLQKRIKDQQYGLEHKHNIDIVIVVDMLLTGFDSKYLNTLYVDKNLRYHGLIQAFSRTNRILNDTKPYGTILDFRQQEEHVDEAIALFSGEQQNTARKIWLVEPAAGMIERLRDSWDELQEFMHSQSLPCTASEVVNLKGNGARATFINKFREIQKIHTQLDQYTDISEIQKEQIKQILPSSELQAFRGVYLEVAKQLKPIQDDTNDEQLEQLEFDLVLFASALIDYDYIMNLIANYTQKTPGKYSVTRDQLVSLIIADAKFIDEREELIQYIDTLPTGQSFTTEQIKQQYQSFKNRAIDAQLEQIAQQHGLELSAISAFVNEIMRLHRLDEAWLTELFVPLGLGWKGRRRAELAFMQDLLPILHKLNPNQEIAGLSVYEQ